MEILPNTFVACLATFHPLLRAEVFLTFMHLVTGLLLGEVKSGAGERLRTGSLSTSAHVGLSHDASCLITALAGRAGGPRVARSVRRAVANAFVLAQ